MTADSLTSWRRRRRYHRSAWAAAYSRRPCAHGYWYGHCPICHGVHE